jgi:GcrA cell cycle regulator
VVNVHLRNAHPKQTVYLPIAPGWCRVLRPAVTTSVPARVLHTPVVRQLLIRKLVDVVDGAAWDADARQRRASCTDMARAIAAAEQREFDQLLKGVRIRQTGPPSEDAHKGPATPYAVLVAAATAAGLDTNTLKALLNGEIALPTILKELGVKHLVTERRASKHQGFVHWRGRNQSARTLLAAAQKARQTTDPQAAAATWLVGELAKALPAALVAAPGVLPRWPPERIALLRQRWNACVPREKIAAELGVTRGAIQGKATRLGLPGRHGQLGTA